VKAFSRCRVAAVDGIRITIVAIDRDGRAHTIHPKAFSGTHVLIVAHMNTVTRCPVAAVDGIRIIIGTVHNNELACHTIHPKPVSGARILKRDGKHVKTNKSVGLQFEFLPLV
jgi:hypothetical protein